MTSVFDNAPYTENDTEKSQLTLVDLKKNSLHKSWELFMFYLVGMSRTSNPGDSISSDPERTIPRRWEEEPGYTEVLQKSSGSLNSKEYG